MPTERCEEQTGLCGVDRCRFLHRRSPDVAGSDTYYVLFFLHLETRRVNLTGITRRPTEEWMNQIGRNATDETSGYLRQQRYVLHDRDAKFCKEFRETLAAGGVKCLRLPARSPNLNAFAAPWVRSVKEECLSKLILFGEGSLTRALNQFQEHYLSERKVTFCYFLGLIGCRRRLDQRSGAARDLAVFSSITTSVRSHEFFGHTGLAPGFVGLYQINVQDPAGLAAGNQPVVITSRNASSPPVLLPIG
jgi:hypothetical protein